MQHGVYTVHDNKAMAFLAPFTAKTDGESIRMFQDIVADSKHMFHRHAHDFHLYRIGSYNDITAELTNMDPPEMLISAVNAIGSPGALEAATLPSNGSSGVFSHTDVEDLSDEQRLRLHERAGEGTL